MNKLDAGYRMKQLIEYLNYHQDLYDKGQSQISDKEWDEAYMELKLLEDQFPSIQFEDSPIRKIRYEVVNELKKVKHEYQPMLSLDKTKDIEEVKEFISNKDWIAMLKLDGLTCRLTYEGGRLVRAETRGNGIEGEDITHNARVLPSIPQLIYYTDTLVVDGEIICDLNTFEQFKEEYANARNFAAGSIRLLDSKECAKRRLTFVAWDCIYGNLQTSAGLSSLLTHKLCALEDLSFHVVPFYCSHDPYAELSLDECVKNMQANTDYPIDGIVFKWDNIQEYQAAGRTDHHFRGGLAYKFYDEEYETELLDIEWSMGRTGVLTPVAVYKDVDTGDSINNRANLHNISVMQELLGQYPCKYQKIWIAKMNQIIPQVTRSEEVANPLISMYLDIPNRCPVCGGNTIIKISDSGTQELFCDNPDCNGKLINKLDHFCGKKGLDIKGLSKATLEKLIDWGWVTKVKDLFTLDQFRHDWINKPGFGIKSVDKILASIEDARHTTLEKYLSAISIPLIGKTYAHQLAQEFKTYEHFREFVTPDPVCGIQPFDFTKLDGFGPAMHDAIMSFDFQEADRMIDMKYVEIVEEDAPLKNFGNSLNGATLVVTGKLKHYKNRDLLKAEIEARGGKVVDSISSKTTYLVNNDINSTSSKNKKAKELNIPIITEEELIAML